MKQRDGESTTDYLKRKCQTDDPARQYGQITAGEIALDLMKQNVPPSKAAVLVAEAVIEAAVLLGQGNPIVTALVLGVVRSQITNCHSSLIERCNNLETRMGMAAEEMAAEEKLAAAGVTAAE